ncbi:Thioredoxin domain-containing protein [Thalassoporum mexicanum PCC 7367]|uniref:thioredoxin domain-containing protein n=1 Tax=Thalassoporum mexicanum TaxID=3457544 RepID=UPI00029FC1FE|nr:thioredoxin domain-containing protein [Pseudanabaena sp. PCC 7367]AFY70918.1 Thioredoxin domain-containing protein [Pseudanabaena sp. PCC 7367]
MTPDQESDTMEAKEAKPNFTAIGVVAIAVLFSLVIFFTSGTNASIFNGSSISGLATLKQMSRQSVTYQNAIANNKPSIVEFYANWCTTCQSLAPTMQALHHKYGNQVNFVMLNVDEPADALIARSFHATAVPQLTFLDRQNQALKTVYGAIPKSVLGEMVKRTALNSL